MAPGLTRAQLERIIIPAAGTDAAVMTSWQFAQQIGCGEDRARAIIRQLIASGWARPERQEFVNMAGLKTKRAAYRFGKLQE